MAQSCSLSLLQVNDLSTEIEKLEESITEIRSEIQKYKGQVR